MFSLKKKAFTSLPWSTFLSCHKIPHKECKDVLKTRQIEVPYQNCSQQVAGDENPEQMADENTKQVDGAENPKQRSAASVVNLREARAFFYAFFVANSQTAAKDANSIYTSAQRDDMDDLERPQFPAKDANSIIDSDPMEDVKRARSSDKSTTTRSCEDVVHTRQVEVPYESCKNVSSVEGCKEHREVVLVAYKECTSMVKEECTLKEKEKKVCDVVKQETEDCKNLLPSSDGKEDEDKEEGSASAASVVNIRTPEKNMRRVRRKRMRHQL